MKNSALLLLFLLVCGKSYGQNYQCIQSGVEHYFVNGDHYLRGIRIDSARLVGTDSVFYPYHTLRAGYYLGPRIYDTAGGSWLGKKVIMQNDGTFLFDNMWNDTVVIKTRASVGSSWVFFDDTTDLRYIATVTAMDTMTFLGIVDSIKTITITADSLGTRRTHDPVDNFTIKLSKNNGFVQAFDVYTFPYHLPDSASGTLWFDFHLDFLLNNLSWGDLGVHSDNHVNSNNSIFKIIDFYRPTYQDIFNYSVGDVRITTEIRRANPPGIVQWDATYHDSITSVSITGSSVTIGATDTFVTHQIVVSTSGPVTHIYTPGTLSSGSNTIYNTDLLAGKMPEEYQGKIYHYYKDAFTGPTACQGDIYVADEIDLRLFHTEPSFGYTIYDRDYTSYGLSYGIMNSHYADNTYSTSYSLSLVYLSRGGVRCYGAFIALPVSVTTLNLPAPVWQIYPNPASENITLTVDRSGSYTISLINTVGQVMIAGAFPGNKATIDTRSIQSGTYILHLTDEYGSKTSKMVSILH